MTHERLRHLDEQIEANANLILSSELIEKNGIEIEEAEDLIADAVGGYLLGLVIIVKDRHGKILFENKNASNLILDIDPKKPWQFISSEGNVIRIFTTTAPKNKRTLYFGHVVSQAIFNVSPYSLLRGKFGPILLITGAIIAYLLSTLLLLPLRNLADYLNRLTSRVDSFSQAPEAIPELRNLKKHIALRRADEFDKLITAVQGFLQKLKTVFSLHSTHSARLAHEINTPLTLIKNQLVTFKASVTESEKAKVDPIIAEVDHLSEFVTHYLEWAENAAVRSIQPELYAIRLETFMQNFCNKVESLAEGRFQVTIQSDATIFANPDDLEHLLLNLFTNAVRYSPQTEPIELEVKGDEIYLRDRGPGIPQGIIDRLGQPFNSSGGKGFGLGLAWIELIVKRYGWNMNINTTSIGTEIRIQLSS